MNLGRARDPIARLLRKAARGEREARRLIYERYNRTIYAVALSESMNEADTQDCAQEAWVRIFHSLQTLRRPDRFPAWACRIVTNCCRMLRRERRRGTVRSSPGSDADAVPTSMTAELQTAMGSLPRAWRLCLMLHLVDGMSLAEVARTVGVPLSTVHWRIARARSRLRERIE